MPKEAVFGRLEKELKRWSKKDVADKASSLRVKFNAPQQNDPTF